MASETSPSIWKQGRHSFWPHCAASRVPRLRIGEALYNAGISRIASRRHRGRREVLYRRTYSLFPPSGSVSACQGFSAPEALIRCGDERDGDPGEKPGSPCGQVSASRSALACRASRISSSSSRPFRPVTLRRSGPRSRRVSSRLGQPAEAARVKLLRAPAVPVWAANRLVREHPELAQRLVSAAERVRAAQLGRDTTIQLASAMGGYRAAVDALLQRLDALLGATGAKVSPPVRLRVRNTLMAAAADPKFRSALLHGDLKEELTAPGFDLFQGAAGRSDPKVGHGARPRRSAPDAGHGAPRRRSVAKSARKRRPGRRRASGRRRRARSGRAGGSRRAPPPSASAKRAQSASGRCGRRRRRPRRSSPGPGTRRAAPWPPSPPPRAGSGRRTRLSAMPAAVDRRGDGGHRASSRRPRVC